MKYIESNAFLILLLMALSIQIAPAAEGNSISYLEGDVMVLQSGEELEGDFGLELFEGDRIITGNDGLVIIELGVTGVLKMKENSSLVLENTGSRTELSLERGSLFSRVNKLSGNSFTLRTESVVAGVRGTEFFMAYGRSFREGEDIWLCVNEGAVEVGITGSDDPVLVREGEGISILGGRKLTSPRYYPWTDDLNWNSDPSKGSVEDKTSLDSVYTDLLDQDYF